MGPPIQIFLTSIASAPALRQRQEHLLRVLQVKKIPFTSYDLAADEEAKKLWRRKAPGNNTTLPGILVGGDFAGTYAEFEEAVEFGELDRFFRLNESWGEEDEALTPAPTPQKPIAVPGVATPSQITGQRPSFAPSPSKPPKKSTPRTKSIDIGAELGFGLDGVKVTEEEMLELVESLGLGGDDAGELVKGLGLSSSKTSNKSTSGNSSAPVAQADTKTNASSEPAGTSTPTDTTAVPNDATKVDSTDPPPAAGKITGPSVGETVDTKSENKDTATKTAPDSSASNTSSIANEAVSKDVPTDGPSHKMSPYYTGPIPTAPRFWDMKAATAASDNAIDRTYHMPGHFDLRSLKQDSSEIVSSPDSSQYYTPAMHQDGFKSSPPSTVYGTPESVQVSPERRVAMYRRMSPDSPSVSPSPSPTDSMFSRSSRPESASSFVESIDECQGTKRSPQRQRSIIPSLVVTDYDSDEEHKPRVVSPPIQATFASAPKTVHQRSMDLRADAVTFRPNLPRDPRQITTVPSSFVNGGATPAVRPQARAVPQYPLPPRSHPYPAQGMPQPPRPVAPATVAPRYKQVPAFQVVPRRFPTPKPILAMRMAGAPQATAQSMQPVQQPQHTTQPRVVKTQQNSTLYDSRGQTFEGQAVRPAQQRIPAMPLSSFRHLWPTSGASLPNAKTNSNVWHPSFQEAQSLISIQQARILKGLPNGVPYGGGLYLPIPFDENLP
ncbi:unnamed protein product [Rhizoctonia solani]|uniref:Uncharacterized protein n=1 Tax=Rhizoctonia solani TaxID=456999 RepID=A0A8H3BHW6_9AGAM|nr:unnamed protein product [Rhizoctonia solani]